MGGLIGLTQSDLMTSLSHGTADWCSPVSVAYELSVQHSNIGLVLIVAVLQCASETFHLPLPCLYRSAKRRFMYAMGVISCMIYLQQQHFIHAHSSMLWMYWQ